MHRFSHWEKKDKRRANKNIDTNYDLFFVSGARNNKKKQEYYFIFIKRSSQFTPKFRDKAADPDLLMEVPHTISNKESPHLKAK